jgi:hypothetical protein
MTRRSGHAPAEEDAIRQVAARLAQQFPDLPDDEVERAVYGKYGSFDDSPVRDFVPMLVERASRGRLAEQRTGRHRA